MLIQSLEQKTRLALTTVLLTVVGSTAICLFTIYKSYSLLQEERSQIYVLDGDIPFLANRAKLRGKLCNGSQSSHSIVSSLFLHPPT